MKVSSNKKFLSINQFLTQPTNLRTQFLNPPHLFLGCSYVLLHRKRPTNHLREKSEGEREVVREIKSIRRQMRDDFPT